MGCRAQDVQLIEEGITNHASKEFWKILGGQLSIQCEHFRFDTNSKLRQIHYSSFEINAFFLL